MTSKRRISKIEARVAELDRLILAFADRAGTDAGTIARLRQARADLVNQVSDNTRDRPLIN